MTTDNEIQYITTLKDTESALAELGFSDSVGLDTETSRPRKIENSSWLNTVYNWKDKNDSSFAPFDPHTCEVRLLQMRGRSSSPFVFDLWKLDDESLARLQEFIRNYSGTFILHNAKFDMKMLYSSLGVWLDTSAKIFDTFQASRLLSNSVGMHDRGHSLRNLALHFIGVDLDKTEQASDWSVSNLSKDQIEYAASDVTHLHELMNLLIFALVNQQGQKEPVELEMSVIGPTARMEYNGLPISLSVYAKVQEAAQYAMPSLLGKIGKYFSDTANQPLTPTYVDIQKADGTTTTQVFMLPWGGGKVGKDFLLSKANLVPEMLSKLDLELDGKAIDNVQKGTLENFRETHPGIGDLIDYWNLVKQAQFDYSKYTHPKTGRIHSKFNISGASTGRFSSTYPNLQQVPGKFYMKHPDGSKMNYRQCFEAPDGWLMCSADFSGQELAVMASLSEDPVMMTILNERGDLHSEAAAGMFNIDPKEARNPRPGDATGKSYRDYGKIVMFSLAYGKTAEGFAKDWKIDKKEAKKIIDGFESKFEKLANWLKFEGALGTAQNYSRLVNGAMRFVGEGKRSDKDAAKRASSNYQIQGLSSWMTRLAMIKLDKRIRDKNLNMELVACVHDELLVIFKASNDCALATLYKSDNLDEIAQEKKSKTLTKQCLESGCGPDCAAHYEAIIGECMREAGEHYLKGKVPAEFDANTRRYWSH